MTIMHVGADGKIYSIWEKDSVMIAASESEMSLSAFRGLTDGSKYVGAVVADDTGGIYLPGDGWEKRGGMRLRDAWPHFVREVSKVHAAPF